MALSTISRPEDLRGARRLVSAVLPGARSGYGRSRFPDGPKIKRHSTEYLRQIYVDAMVFTQQELGHLVVERRRRDHDWGPTTRFPGVRRSTTCSKTAGLSDADKRAILGETLAMLLKLT